MRPLSGLDAAFLYMETPNTPMNVVGTIVLDPATAKEGFSYAQVLELLEKRLHRLPPLRRRLVEIPLGLDHPVWIEDPDFRLEAHVRRVEAPSPGSDRVLARIVADFAARPLDRSRPLWELAVVERLSGGRAALVFKVHHAVADGVANAQMLLQLLDATPDPEGAPLPPGSTASPADWEPDAVPTEADLLGQALFGLALRPARFARVLRETARTAAELARQALVPNANATPATLPLTAPRTRLNRAVSPRRVVAYARVQFKDLRFVKSVFETTLNDVILAACTQSLRSYLEAHGDLPHEPLVATIPVSVRSGEEWKAHGNHISALFVHLPVQLEDPLDQLLAIRDNTREAKRLHSAVGPTALRDWAEFASPVLFANAIRLYSQLKLADRHRPIHNLVISNVPGPSAPLYAAGARVVAVHPHGPIFEGAGVNITVMSYVDSVDFGILACEETVPDVETIALGFGDAVGDLVKLAREEAPAEEADQARPDRSCSDSVTSPADRKILIRIK